MDKKKSFLVILSETRFLHILLSIILGFVVGAFFLVIMGLSVSAAYGRLLSSVTSVKGFSYVVVYAIPYIVTGLSVAFSFKTGVFNIGAEGQFVMGSMAAAVVGILLGDLPKFVLIPLCFLAAAAAGALWGLVVGVLKTKWGINEVLSMIMFNWIAFYLSNYIVSIPAIHSEGTAEATKNVSDAARILLPQSLREGLNLASTSNWGILLAGIFAILIYMIIEKTTLGYELKAVGFNRHAAEYGGINTSRAMLTALRRPGGHRRCGAGAWHGPAHQRFCRTGGLWLRRHRGGAYRRLQSHWRLCGGYLLRRFEIRGKQAQPHRRSL